MPKPTEYDKTHLRNMAAIGTRIDRIFKKATEEAAKIGVSIKSALPDDRIFSFDDYPATKKQIERLLSALQESMETVIVNGVRSAWTLSNNKNNALVSRIFGDRVKDLSEEQYRRYYSTNGAALDAFLERKAQGLNLSDRVWRYANAFKREIELGLDLGIRSGESAAKITRSLRQYLQHPDMLFRRVRDQHGNLKLSKAARDYHPGRGVYRSSYKNARRLACTETNMAYRTSDHLRWQQMEFVVGIEIKLSNNHTLNGVPLTDICDTLAGRYPKDFKFVGWHPHCRCHVVTVLKTDDEMAEDTQRILAGEQPKKGSVNTVRDVPDAFKGWVEEHANRIEMSGNLPYFLKDNRKIISNLLTEKMPQLIAGTGDPIFDYIENYNLPKSIRDRFELYNSLKSFNDFKMFFAERGIELSTDFEELLDKADEYFEPIALQCRKLSIAYDTYTNLLGKDCLKSLKRINLFDNGEDMGSAQAAYFYNMIGEKDPWAGVLRIRTNNLNGHTAFHELAHAIQDSVKRKGEDAVMAATRIVKECSLNESVGAYFGASAYAMEAERMADAFANVFTRKKMSKEFEFFTEVRKYLRHPQNEIKTIEEIAIKRHANRDVAKIQKTWNARRIANIEDAAKKGLFPKECLKGLSAMKLPEFNARIAYLQKTAQRHAARSPQDIEDIKKAWEAKLTKDRNTRTMADNVLKLRSEYPIDVDFSALEKIITDNNLTKMREEARNVAQAIKTIRAEEKALSDLIPDAHGWHKTFTLSELREAHGKIQSTIDYWKAKGYDIMTDSHLDILVKELKQKIEFVENPGAFKVGLKAHKTWQVQQDSYIKLLDKVENRIETIKLEADYNLLLGFKTASKSFKDFMVKAKAAIDTGDVKTAKSYIASAKCKKTALEYSRKVKTTNVSSSMSFDVLYSGGCPFTPTEIAKIKDYEDQILQSMMDYGFVENDLNKKYHDYILRLSEKYYGNQKSIFSAAEQTAMKKAADTYLARPSINPGFVWGTDVGGVYKGRYQKRYSYLNKLGNGITADELSIVQRFTNGSTFSNAYNLRHSSPYWAKKWKEKMAQLPPAQAKEMEQIIEEWSQGANFTLDRMVRYNGITFRGLDCGGGPELRAQLTKAFNSGTAWVNEASCSTSMKYSVASSFDGDLIMIIHNKTGAYIHAMSDYGSEYEIMTLRGAKYRVIKPPTQIGGRWIAELEEI